MATLQIRDFPDELYRILKESAEKDRRSISQQAIVLLEESLRSGSIRRRKILDSLTKLDIGLTDSEQITEMIRSDRAR